MKRAGLFFLAISMFLLPCLSLGATANMVYLKVNKTEILVGERVKVYGHVTPKKKNVKVRIFQKTTGNWQYLVTKTTKKKGYYHYHAMPTEDTYYRAKIKIHNKWTWGSKKKFITVTQPQEDPEDPEEELYPACGDEYTWFSQKVMDDGTYHSISPLGVVNPSGHTFPTDHIYFYFNDYTLVNNVYAPGDIYIESITAQEHLSAVPVFTDYTVRFRPCADVYGFFMHMSGISEGLAAAYEEADFDPNNCTEYENGGQSYRICSRDVSYQFSAGEIIGTAGGNEGQNALDWGVYDMRAEITGVANSAYFSDQILYNVCPLDYYDAVTKDYLYDYLGYWDERRTIEPLCGTIHQDVSGTAQGRWFLSGTEVGLTWQEDHQLALIHEPVDFAQGLFSVGDSISSLSTGKYEFTPTFSGYVNRDFDEVTADGERYCYDTDNGEILIQLTSDTTLRIESQDLGSCGSGPWSFTAAYTDFER